MRRYSALVDCSSTQTEEYPRNLRSRRRCHFRRLQSDKVRPPRVRSIRASKLLAAPLVHFFPDHRSYFQITDSCAAAAWLTGPLPSNTACVVSEGTFFIRTKRGLRTTPAPFLKLCQTSVANEGLDFVKTRDLACGLSRCGNRRRLWCWLPGLGLPGLALPGLALPGLALPGLALGQFGRKFTRQFHRDLCRQRDLRRMPPDGSEPLALLPT